MGRRRQRFSSPPAFISEDALLTKPQRAAALTVFRCTAKISLHVSAENLIQQITGQQFIGVKTGERQTPIALLCQNPLVSCCLDYCKTMGI